MNTIEEIEKENIENLTKEKEIPDFNPGDTVKVQVKVVEGQRERLQAFEGVCIAKKNRGINSSFTIRKISYGEGVERVFPLYSPNAIRSSSSTVAIFKTSIPFELKICNLFLSFDFPIISGASSPIIF